MPPEVVSDLVANVIGVSVVVGDRVEVALARDRSARGDHDASTPEHTVALIRAIPNAQLCIVPNEQHGVLPLETVLNFLSASNSDSDEEWSTAASRRIGNVLVDHMHNKHVGETRAPTGAGVTQLHFVATANLW